MVKRFKKQNWQRQAVVAVIFASALGAYAGSGYLETAGPAPMRFLPPLHPAPKIVHAPEPVVSTPTLAEPVMPIVVATNAAVVTVVPTPEPVVPVVETNAVPTTPQGDEAVYPQMLLKYFNKGTGNSVYMPLNMNAQQPTGAAPSSSATYTNAP
jgi:hypothetical protein